MHASSYRKMQEFSLQHLTTFRGKEARVLDIGSQDVNGSYRPLFDDPKWVYRGLDIQPAKNVDIVVKDMYDWREVQSNNYEIVISGQTLEHVEYFWLTIFEIVRVMKKNGICCIIVPASGFEHRYPVDCWRFFPDGLKALARYAGLEVLECYNKWAPDEQWKDSVLIAKKNSSFVSSAKNALKHQLLKGWLR